MWGVGVGGTVVGEGWAWGCTRVGSVGTPAYPMHPIADGRVGETSGRGQNSKDIHVDIRVEGRVYSTAATHSAVKRVAPISLARPASSPHAVWVRLTSALSTPHCTFAWLCRTNRVDFVELLLRLILVLGKLVRVVLARRVAERLFDLRASCSALDL